MRRSLAGLSFAALLALTLLAGCKGGNFVASNASNKYHDPSCIWADKIDSDRRVWFETTAEAEKAGYVACGECSPTDAE